MDRMHLHILTPEGSVTDMLVSLVTLPGEAGPFTVLENHAAIVTSLVEGDVRYMAEGAELRIHVREGFAEVSDNNITVCARI
ncbi:MAG: hypothetical protein IJ627_02965 [Bacteroidales bacterium]|nr:hypothetical protein [Bacteroidales bacterium]MBR6886047.1 hypothetical protein [Bacteroidales bacterium]